MLAVLLAVLALAPARTPHDAVYRFIANRSPADACAQLAPAYQKALAVSYGPCLAGMKRQPKATRIKVFAQHVAGAKATVEATYVASGGAFHERYRLARIHGAWLITGAAQL